MPNCRNAAVVLFLLGSACAAQTGTPPSAEILAFCEANPCRQTENGPVPFILDDRISIVEGERLSLAATEVDGRLVDFREFGVGDGPVPILILEFEKNLDEIALHIDSTFDRYLKFHIQMRFEGRSDWFETTSCALMPYASNVELWSDPIEELRLFDFHVVEEGSEEANICQY